MMDEEMQLVFGRKDSRHLSEAAPQQEGRRLRSAFDVFDFVNNAISSGVKEAKHTQKEIISTLGDAQKFLGPVAKDASEAVAKKTESELAKFVDQIEEEVVEALQDKEKEPVVEIEEPADLTETVTEPQHIVEMAAPTSLCGHDEALNALGPNKCKEHGECDGARTCS